MVRRVAWEKKRRFSVDSRNKMGKPKAGVGDVYLGGFRCRMGSGVLSEKVGWVVVYVAF